MDPLNDDELNRLLRTWNAPEAPLSLDRRVLAKDVPLWRRVFGASFRVPVPVAVAAAIVIVLLLIYRPTATPPNASSPTANSLAGFQPVIRLEPVLYIGGRTQ